MKFTTTTTFKYTNLSLFHDEDNEEEKSCYSSSTKKSISEPYPLRIYSKSVRTMMTEEPITASPPKQRGVRTMLKEEPIIASPPRQSRVEENSSQPFQETFPDEFNPFRADAKLSVVSNCKHREGALVAASTPTKAEVDLLFNVPLTLGDSPTTVVQGPGSSCYIHVESLGTPDTKADRPVTGIASTGGEETKTDEGMAEVDSQIASLCIDKLNAFDFGSRVHRIRASKEV
jgi:hypothetical protein